MSEPVGADDRLEAQLRLACALCQFPIGAVYAFEGARANLVAVFGTAPGLPPDVPAWRALRDRVALVPVVGRGPAAPETAIFPADLRVNALVSAPLQAPDGQIGALLLADPSRRDDLDFIDIPSLELCCTMLGESLRPTRDPSEHKLSLPPRAGGEDPVTGLRDQRALERPFSQVLQFAQARGDAVAFAIVALDRFTRINDWLGRDVGDKLLRQVAERLVENTEDHDLVARASGDEFYVVLTSRPADRMLATAHRLAHAIRSPFHVQGYELAISASLGVSRFPEDAGDIETLLRYAEIALHRAKSARTRGKVETFSEELRAAVERRGDTERQLRRAMGAGELLLHYQPKVDLGSRRTRAVEALIRWRRQGKLVSPARFVPIAEESGLIVPMGTWVMLEAARQMKRWVDDSLPIESVSVNVSAQQFARPDFVESVERVLGSADLHPGHLELEVTETSLMDDVDDAVQTLSRLRALGVRISVDDFGTGYSSLSYLQKLPVDVLKIDRAFVKDLDAEGMERAQALALAEAIHGLGHSLGLKVLAEGVETEEQLRVLEELGCDEVQGYYFSKPLPAHDVPAFISE